MESIHRSSGFLCSFLICLPKPYFLPFFQVKRRKARRSVRYHDILLCLDCVWLMWSHAIYFLLGQSLWHWFWLGATITIKRRLMTLSWTEFPAFAISFALEAAIKPCSLLPNFVKPCPGNLPWWHPNNSHAFILFWLKWVCFCLWRYKCLCKAVSLISCWMTWHIQTLGTSFPWMRKGNCGIMHDFVLSVGLSWAFFFVKTNVYILDYISKIILLLL